MAGESRYSKASLTAETIPHTGYLLPWDSSADSAMKTIDPALLNPFWYYKQDITAWNMQTNILKSITISAGVAAYVSHVEKVVIYDDNGLVYDGSSVYDRYLHDKAIRRANVGVGGVSGTTGSSYGTSLKHVLTGKFVSNTWTLIRGTVTSAVRNSNGVYTIVLDTAYNADDLFVSVELNNLNVWQVVKTATPSMVVSFVDVGGSYVNTDFNINFYVKTGTTNTTDGHTHTFSSDAGYVIGNMNAACYHITSQLDKVTGVVKLAHNNYGNYDNYETSGFGSLVPTNAGQFPDFTSISGVRGYIILAMNYAT
jgi:hypothetical protein